MASPDNGHLSFLRFHCQCNMICGRWHPQMTQKGRNPYLYKEEFTLILITVWIKVVELWLCPKDKIYLYKFISIHLLTASKWTRMTCLFSTHITNICTFWSSQQEIIHNTLFCALNYSGSLLSIIYLCILQMNGWKAFLCYFLFWLCLECFLICLCLKCFLIWYDMAECWCCKSCRSGCLTGVFFGALCIGMAGVASMMGSVLQVKRLFPPCTTAPPCGNIWNYKLFDVINVFIFRQLCPYLAWSVGHFLVFTY